MSDPFQNPLNTLTGAPLASQFVATSYIGSPFAGWILSLLLFGMVASNFSNYLDTGLYKNDSIRTKVSRAGGPSAAARLTGLVVPGILVARGGAEYSFSGYQLL